MSRVLGVDASGPALAVGLVEADQVVAEFFWQQPRTAGSHLVAWIDQVVQTYGWPDAFAVGVGPGSFTGTRVAVTAAKMLAWARALPLYGVSSLAAWALSLPAEGLVLVTSEQRGNAFYAGLYRRRGKTVETVLADFAVQDSLPAPFPLSEEVRVLGAIARQSSWIAQVGPRAEAEESPLLGSAVARLGLEKGLEGPSDSPVGMVPNYLKRPALGRSREG